ncbi:MAG: hypothetical protein NZM38_08175 [Cytophagales bacterium]|nr:hypothetical protein [Cytophagales bacterium]MDW8384733.1 hypothetical protein [Flammeovirgaceae bacterium]
MKCILYFLFLILISCQKDTSRVRPSPIPSQSFRMSINGQEWQADSVEGFFFIRESFFLIVASSAKRKVEIRFRAYAPTTLSLQNSAVNYVTVSLGDKFPLSPPSSKLSHEGDHVEYFVTQHPEASGFLHLTQVFQDLVTGRFEFVGIALPSEGNVVHVPKIVVTQGAFHTRIVKK